MTSPTTPLPAATCSHCGIPLTQPAAQRGEQYLCGPCLDDWAAHMREVEEHEARIAAVPHVAMLIG